MDNSGWKDYETNPPPPDSVVMVWFNRKVLGSRLHTMRTSAQGFDVVAGVFLFDLREKVLCWKETDSVIADVPLKFEKEAP